MSVVNDVDYVGRGIMGAGAVVAVIDSGFDVLHPALIGRIISARDFPYVNEAKSYEIADAIDHGTPVASIIVKYAPAARLMLLKAAALDGTVMGSGSVTRAINYAIDWRGKRGERVTIINLSLGGGSFPGKSDMHAAIKRAVDNGIVVVCGAGNDGDGNPNTNEIAYPAIWPEVVSVGAHDERLKVARYSNTNDEVDILAPGYARAAKKGGGYRTFTGTSCAAPHVSAALALLYEYLCRKNGRRPTLDELIAELLRNTKSDIKDAPGRLYLQYEEYTSPTPEELDLDFVIDEFARLGIFDSPDYWKTGVFGHEAVTNQDHPLNFLFRYFALGYKKLYHYITYGGGIDIND